jgi:hypothetical protein
VDANLYYETPLVGPRVEPKRLESLGFDIVALPLVSLQSTIVHLFKTLRKVQADGISAYEALESEFEGLPTEGDTDKPRQLIHEITGLEEVQGWERDYLPDEDQQKYADSIGAE